MGLTPIVLEKWKRFEELVSPLANFGLLREACAKSSPPVIPPISLILKDLIFIEEGNDTWYDKTNSILNFGKLRLLGRVALMLRQSTSERYVLSTVPFIQHYLKNVFYVDDIHLLDSFSKVNEPSVNVV